MQRIGLQLSLSRTRLSIKRIARRGGLDAVLSNDGYQPVLRLQPAEAGDDINARTYTGGVL